MAFTFTVKGIELKNTDCEHNLEGCCYHDALDKVSTGRFCAHGNCPKRYVPEPTQPESGDSDE